uniref:Uncharacterized protein n=1 Tax=Ornithorhynchus anatinus TaxID=9258 RepID=A0A6I8PIE6_ORNAN
EPLPWKPLLTGKTSTPPWSPRTLHRDVEAVVQLVTSFLGLHRPASPADLSQGSDTEASELEDWRTPGPGSDQTRIPLHA